MSTLSEETVVEPSNAEIENLNSDDPLLTKVVKAGRRVYFFDVRETRGGDQFLTITESRKKTNEDGSASFDRHKLFLYEEDFDKFSQELGEVIDFIRQQKTPPSEE